MEIDKQSLDARTRQRNTFTWLTLDFGGIMAPLADMEAELDALASPGIENYMAISGEAWGIREKQRDRTIELSQAEIDQDAAVAAAKAATGSAKIAIERAADEYSLAAKIYDAQVKTLLMAAREFAGLVEQDALAAEAAKAAVDVEKEGVRQTKVAVQIQIEAIEAAQVAADIAKAQVEVARAHVRAALAGVEAGKAAVEVVETQVQVAMAEAEKATLQADVAMIFAEIVTKQLTEVKLGAEKAEIQAGYALINSRLADAVTLYGARALSRTLGPQLKRLWRGKLQRIRPLSRQKRISGRLKRPCPWPLQTMKPERRQAKSRRKQGYDRLWCRPEMPWRMRGRPRAQAGIVLRPQPKQ